MSKVFYLSRERAEGVDPSDHRAMISIQPRDLSLKRGWRHLLSLDFDDVCHEMSPVWPLRPPLNSIYRLFTHRHGIAIVAFVDALRAWGVTELYVHCEAGISRSPTVATFCAERLGWSLIDARRRYCNHWVDVVLRECVDPMIEHRPDQQESARINVV